jgi:hypothetical protein
MTDLGEILKLATDVGTLLKYLKQAVSAPADAQDGLQGLASRAQQFGKCARSAVHCKPWDRIAAVSAEILNFAANLSNKPGPAQGNNGRGRRFAV